MVSVPHDGGWEDWWRGGMVRYTPGGTAPPLRLSPRRPPGVIHMIIPRRENLTIHGPWMVKFSLLGIIMCMTPGGLRGLSLKGGAVPPGVYLTIPPLHQSSHPPSWGTLTMTTLSLYVQPGPHPHPRLHPHHLLPGGLSVDAVPMRGWAIG